MPGLTAGRDVHFFDGLAVSPSDTSLKPNAAKIAEVLDYQTGRVNLARLLPNGEWLPWSDVPYSETPKPGCWSWMARV